jgi:YidC/Oxa1 family membrane protein insertase
MNDINETKEKETKAESEKFVMAVEESKNLASKKRKKNK